MMDADQLADRENKVKARWPEAKAYLMGMVVRSAHGRTYNERLAFCGPNDDTIIWNPFADEKANHGDTAVREERHPTSSECWTVTLNIDDPFAAYGKRFCESLFVTEILAYLEANPPPPPAKSHPLYPKPVYAP